MNFSTHLISWQDFGNPIVLKDSNNTVKVDLSSSLATNYSGFFSDAYLMQG